MSVLNQALFLSFEEVSLAIVSMNKQQMTFVIIPRVALDTLLDNQQKILQQLQHLQPLRDKTISIKHITAKEFMAAVRICRSKFDQLARHNKIKIIKKRRKIYVPASEVDRYFSDANIG